jgi:LmbE family N-acetylglucosaminyl deacetylase
VKNPVDVLVISAHPDDAEFGAAGTIARWTLEGKEVVYVVCTSGDKGTSDPALKPEVLTDIREKEQRDAAEVLGVREVEFLRFPDQGLEDTHDFRKQIVRMIRIYRPKTVVTSDPYRKYFWHRDHRMVGQVTVDAVYPYARDHLAYPDLLQEGLTPHKAQEMLFWGSENINYRSDITDTFDKKLQALSCHKSQVKEFGVPDLAGWLREFCREMADTENFELGEAFHHITIPW